MHSGRKLIVLKSFYTLAGVCYQPGDTLELIEPTGLNPFKVQMDENHNWIVKCKYFSPPDDRSVWSNILYGIKMGLYA